MLSSWFKLRTTPEERTAWHRMADLRRRNLAAIARELLNREVVAVNRELEQGKPTAALGTLPLPHMERD